MATDEEIEEWNTVLLSHGQRYSQSKHKVIPWFLPFDRVLVRNEEYEEWEIDLFKAHISDDTYEYEGITGNTYRYCIHYEGNEHLYGTTNDEL